MLAMRAMLLFFAFDAAAADFRLFSPRFHERFSA